MSQDSISMKGVLTPPQRVGGVKHGSIPTSAMPACIAIILESSKRRGSRPAWRVMESQVQAYNLVLQSSIEAAVDGDVHIMVRSSEGDRLCDSKTRLASC